MMHRCMGCMAEYSAELSACPYCNYQKNSKALQPYCLEPETVLDRKYIVGRVVSEDAFAISYLAWDFENNQSVVIKEYFPKELSSRMPGQTEVSFYDGEKAKQYESGLMAFVEEANQLVRLTQNLDGVAKVYNLFVENSTAYTVNEYLETVSFKDIISMEGRLPWQDAVALMFPLIESLDTMHRNNVINYGITPDKIVMTRDRAVKLLDFGGSRFETVGTNKNLSLITDEGFSAIELYRDDDVTAASDVYSVAATLYYAITGVIPDSAINRSNNDKLKTPSQLGVEISESAENAIMNALNVNAAFRTSSCSELINQLYSQEPVERIIDTSVKKDNGKWSKKAKIAVSVVAVVVVAVIAGIFVLLSSPQNAAGKKTPALADFYGMTYKQVVKEMKSYGYEVKIEEFEKGTDDKSLDGKVIEQNPKSGESYNVDDEEKVLSVYIGKYVENLDELKKTKIEMPDLKGKTKEEAGAIIKKAGFLDDPVYNEEYSSSVEAGKVCAQSVEAGDTVTAGTKITITISKGEKPTTTQATTEKADNKTTVKATTKTPTKTQTTKAPTTKAPTTKAPTTKAPTPPPVVTPPKGDEVEVGGGANNNFGGN